MTLILGISLDGHLTIWHRGIMRSMTYLKKYTTPATQKVTVVLNKTIKLKFKVKKIR
jgi:hypothetical protein